MNFQKTAFAWFASLFFSALTFAQLPNRIEWTSDNDLLPQNSVKSIVQDKFGYIWLSTENGLVRFDGKEYKTYNSQNLNLKSNRILSIQGNLLSDSLFVATDNPNDLILINSRIARAADRLLPGAKVYLEEADRTFNGDGNNPYTIDLKNWSYKILLPSYRYYIITKSNIRYFSASDKILKDTPLEEPNTKLFFTLGEKLFYLKDAKQYAVFTDGKIEWCNLNFKISDNYKIIWNKVCNQVYIQSGNQLFLLKNENKALSTRYLLKDAQLQFKNITSAYYDIARDIVFLGSSTNGLGTYRSRSFKTISITDDKQSSVFYAAEPLTDKTILTSSGFVMNKDTILHNYNFINQEKTTMLLDSHENLWLKSSNELYYYSKKSSYKTVKTYIFTNKIETFYQDDSQKIWLSLVMDSGDKSKLLFFRTNENAVFRNYMNLDFKVNYMHKSDDGKLWLAGSNGLYLLDDQKHTLKHICGTSNLNIRSILQTGPDEVWIATYGNGFYLHKANKIYSFPLDKNGYLATAHFFMEDAKGFFWIPTNKGLFQVKKNILLSYIKNPKQNIYYHYYNKESGFLTNEFNGGASPYSVKLGSQFFIPSMNGMVTFDTEKIKPLEPKNPINIDEIKVDDKMVSTTDELLLPNDYERVTFSFSSPYYGNVLNANYEVKLEGATNLAWTSITAENKYSFTKIAPGSYTLIIRKLSGFDSKYIYKKMAFKIAPTFYQTNWFILIIVVAILFLVYCFTKIYSNNVRRRNKILTLKISEKTEDLQETISTLRATRDNMKKQADKNNKLIQIISHDIKSPLKFMSMASKYMYEDFDPNSPDLKENILALYTSSSQIYNFLDNVLSYSKINDRDGELENKPFHVHEEIQNKIRLFKNIANANRTQLINLVPSSLLLNTNRSFFAIILHNILDNALKHTDSGVVEFSTEEKEDATVFIIRDQGQGMDLETLNYYRSVIVDFDSFKNKSNKKLGLHLVIELMIILNGKIEIDSVLGSGCKVTLTFKN